MSLPIIAASILFVFFVVVWKGIKIVPQQNAWIIERLGRYSTTLQPGLSYLIPFVDRVAYKHSLKEYAMDVQQQEAITRDNVTLAMDGVIYLRIVDPVQASYGVSNPVYAATQLAQTTMRSEIGKLTLDQSFEERERLNANIVNAINEAAQTWGIQCMRYEIKNITPPASVLKAMEMQVAADRQKRAQILQSEGERQAKINESEGLRQSSINIAEGRKQEVVLASEAAQIDQANRAKGEAEAIIAVADASAKGLELIAAAIRAEGGEDAVSMKIAEQYIDAFKNLARSSTTVLLPANAGDTAGVVTQALSVFEALRHKTGGNTSGPWKNPA
ncbi:MAG: stomatin-like protein [Rickettsiales bacterium]